MLVWACGDGIIRFPECLKTLGVLAVAIKNRTSEGIFQNTDPTPALRQLAGALKSHPRRVKNEDETEMHHVERTLCYPLSLSLMQPVQYILIVHPMGHDLYNPEATTFVVIWYVEGLLGTIKLYSML